MYKAHDLRVRDSLFDPDDPEIIAAYRGTREKPRYRVFLYLEGRDLDFVERVAWHLHPSFRRSTLDVARSIKNRHCKVTLWTWGVFMVRADVRTVEGSVLHLRHEMSYDRDITPSTQFRSVA